MYYVMLIMMMMIVTNIFLVDDNDNHDYDADNNRNGIILFLVVTDIRFTLQASNNDENALKTTSILCKRWNDGIFFPQRKGCWNILPSGNWYIHGQCVQGLCSAEKWVRSLF